MKYFIIFALAFVTQTIHASSSTIQTARLFDGNVNLEESVFADNYAIVSKLFAEGTVPEVTYFPGWYTGRCYRKPNGAPLATLLMLLETFENGPLEPGTRKIVSIYDT